MHYSVRSLLFSGLFFAFAANATTIIPFANLADLYAASDGVAMVQAGPRYETPTESQTYYDCDFTVLLPLKGTMVGNDVFPLRQYSSYDNISRVNIAGDFVPKEGHSYLMFLKKQNDAWHLMVLSYYVFEQVNINNISYLVPVEQSFSMITLPSSNGSTAEPLTTYRKDALLELLRQQNKGAYVPWDGRSAQAAPSIIDQVSDRVLPAGCDFGPVGSMVRWQNTAINVYYDFNAAVPNTPADGPARLSAVIATMNTEYPGLHLVASGPTDFTPNCAGGTARSGNFSAFANALNLRQTNIVMFEDPCNEIADLVLCGGTLAMGGTYFFSGPGQTHTYKGDTWLNGGLGFLMVNNGARACLPSDVDYERMLTHEMTHSMGMNHLPSIDDNMSPLCCNPISADDRTCMNYVYDIALPVELITFDARATKSEVVLNWTTAQEINNDYFIVERATKDWQFERLATVEASNTSHSSAYNLTDEQPAPGLNYYRLSQVDRDGQIKELGLRSVTYRGETSGYTLVPNPVPGSSIILKSRAKEPAIGSLQIFNSTGGLVYQLSDRAQLENSRLEVPVGDLPAGVYWLKISESGRAETLKFVRL